MYTARNAVKAILKSVIKKEEFFDPLEKILTGNDKFNA